MATLLYGTDRFELPDTYSRRDFEKEALKRRSVWRGQLPLTFPLKGGGAITMYIFTVPLAFIESESESRKLP
ncbi:hypothetical protein [Frondihabitans sp. Leaf304]|uniref:hypothetical protein n=1 Tax=Frondihabitans sp. Leaf304 TaxID=1736329 RepID=UPI0006F3F981|nr:hypothetical protein [Frondihabitans sp. Leaf304]KQQ25442.1 hypothetical protein ASF54_13500 [Frondihabitans sp. Leaf304]